MTPLLEPGHPLRKLFAGLVEQAFMVEMGVCEPQLTAYLGDMLAGFVHVDSIYRLRTVDNQVIRDVSRMEAEAVLGSKVDEATRRRFINRYIGDLTLFWAGVYPEQLTPRHSGGVSRLGPYVYTGKRSYGIASELTTADEHPPADVLAQLSAQFEYCVHGLHLVRAGWEQLAAEQGRN